QFAGAPHEAVVFVRLSRSHASRHRASFGRKGRSHGRSAPRIGESADPPSVVSTDPPIAGHEGAPLTRGSRRASAAKYRTYSMRPLGQRHGALSSPARVAAMVVTLAPCGWAVMATSAPHAAVASRPLDMRTLQVSVLRVGSLHGKPLYGIRLR